MLPHPMLRERGEILDDEDDEVVKIEKLSESWNCNQLCGRQYWKNDQIFSTPIFNSVQDSLFNMAE